MAIELSNIIGPHLKKKRDEVLFFCGQMSTNAHKRFS